MTTAARTSSAPVRGVSCGRFVLLTVGRTGSNWLCTLLDSHPDILCHHEIFNEERIIYAFSRRDGSLDLGTMEDRDRDPLGFLERVWRERCGKRFVGFKLCPGQDERIFDAVLGEPEIKKLILHRRNRIKTFVSRRLAEATGQWESYPGQKVSTRGRRLRVDVADLWAYVTRIQEFYGGLGETLASAGQRPLWLTYEELATAEERRRILGFLGAGSPGGDLVGQTRKMSSDDLRDVVLNFAELEQELRGSSLYEDLFRD